MRALIGNQIRKLREAHQITQEDIAKSLNMTRQRFARIEKGQFDISYDIIVAIADILNVNPREITNVCENNNMKTFGNGGASSESFEKIEEMISLFYANKSIYVQMNVEKTDDKYKD